MPTQSMSPAQADQHTAPTAPVSEAAWTPPSWDEVVREHADRVYRLAYRLTGNQHDAEDLTQETFIRVFRSLASYKPGTFEGWLHRITTNLFLDQARRKSRIRFDALADDHAARLPSSLPAPDAVVLDLRLPDASGGLLLKRIRQLALPTKVAVVTGLANPVADPHLRQFAPDAVFGKPLDYQALMDWLEPIE